MAFELKAYQAHALTKGTRPIDIEIKWTVKEASSPGITYKSLKTAYMRCCRIGVHLLVEDIWADSFDAQKALLTLTDEIILTWRILIAEAAGLHP